MPDHALISLDAVIVAVTDDTPRVLVVTDGGVDALPSGPLDLVSHPTLERGMRSWVAQQTGLALGHVEQLYTFGDRFRDPREVSGGPRVISAAYLALVREGRLAAGFEAAWADWYAYLPWEDWRNGRPALIDTRIVPLLATWMRSRAENADRARHVLASMAGVAGKNRSNQPFLPDDVDPVLRDLADLPADDLIRPQLDRRVLARVSFAEISGQWPGVLGEGACAEARADKAAGDRDRRGAGGRVRVQAS